MPRAAGLVFVIKVDTQEICDLRHREKEHGGELFHLGERKEKKVGKYGANESNLRKGVCPRPFCKERAKSAGENHRDKSRHISSRRMNDYSEHRLDGNKTRGGI